MIPQRGKASGAGIKLLTPNKLLTRLSILLAQKKLETIHTMWKMKTEKYFIFLINRINHQKTLQQFNQVIIMME